MGGREFAVSGSRSLLEKLGKDAGDPLEWRWSLERLGHGGNDRVGGAWQLGNVSRVASAGPPGGGTNTGIGGGELRDEAVCQRRRPLRPRLREALVAALVKLYGVCDGREQGG